MNREWEQAVDARRSAEAAWGQLEELMALQEEIEAMAKLSVLPTGLGLLLVDAGRLMTNPNGVQFWRLESEEAGRFKHRESGTEGSLSEVLRSIACTYLNPSNDFSEASVSAPEVEHRQETSATFADAAYCATCGLDWPCPGALRG